MNEELFRTREIVGIIHTCRNGRFRLNSEQFIFENF